MRNKAFAHAAPGIRAQFGTADNFLAMVRTAYDALIAARYTEFLEGAVIEGVVIQPLRLIAPDNTVQVALYTMEKQKSGGWKIAGCVLAPSTRSGGLASARDGGVTECLATSSSAR